MKKIIVALIVLMFLSCSCESLQHWLFDASDYHLIERKTNDEDGIDEQDQYWDGVDYEIWYDENEYD